MNSPAPLDSLMVVTLEQAVAAPLCSMRLADAGARVIKLERPEGDFARRYDRAAAGGSSYFVWLNRGKESAVVDLRSADDCAWVRRLIGRADVFIENLAPGAASRLGLDVHELRASHPRLVTCSITGYGAGPFEDRKAYDLLVQAEAGLASITGSPDQPGRVGVSVVDIATGLAAHAAILEALLERHRSGQGRHICISLFDAIAEWMTVPLMYLEGTGRSPERVGLNHPTIAPYGLYACGDGGAVLLSIQNDREWGRFCSEVLGAPALAVDERFRSNDDRVARRPELDALIGTVFGRIGRDECQRRLDAAAIAYGLLNSVSGLASHPHLKRIQVETAGGPVAVVAPPDRDRHQDGRRVPDIGEHTAALREEFD
jgi:crotonobetainyl-CoA:carnitine CoA-transferase CaiB-like acyl-CoA transferase